MSKKKKKRRSEVEVEVKEVREETKPSFADVWDSELQVCKKVRVKIPFKLLSVCNSIQRELGEYEFSILAKGKWTEDGFVLSEDYIIPEQEVERASVEYLEDLAKLRAEGYNVVIHSHPFSFHDFSATDEETINTHFACSILYSQGKFVKAVVSVKVSENVALQLEAKIEIDYEVYEEIDISKIKKHEYPTRFRHTYYDEDYVLKKHDCGNARFWDGRNWRCLICGEIIDEVV